MLNKQWLHSHLIILIINMIFSRVQDFLCNLMQFNFFLVFWSILNLVNDFLFYCAVGFVPCSLPVICTLFCLNRKLKFFFFISHNINIITHHILQLTSQAEAMKLHCIAALYFQANICTKASTTFNAGFFINILLNIKTADNGILGAKCKIWDMIENVLLNSTVTTQWIRSGNDTEPTTYQHQNL